MAGTSRASGSSARLSPSGRSTLLEAIAVLVTYSRLPPEVLYNVDSAGDLAVVSHEW